MDFEQAESRFKVLEDEFRSGRLSEEQYQAELREASVTDSQGQFWEMQPHTGQWNVYTDEGWVPAIPPGQRPPAEQPQPRSRRRIGRLAGAGVIIMAVGVCAAALLIGGYFLLPRLGYDLADLFPSGQTTEQPDNASPQLEATWNDMETVSVPPDGGVYSDSNGVSAQMPVGVLGQDLMVNMVASEIGGDLAQALATEYTLDTPFYSLGVMSADDGAGRAELSFPAPSAESRVLVVIDETYLALLDVAPQDGRLQARAPVAPADAAGIEPMGTVTWDGDIRYAVVTPKQTSMPARGVPHLASPSRQGGGKDCGTVSRILHLINSPCRKNLSGTVLVMWDSTTVGATASIADDVANAVAAYMDDFGKQHGFTGANLSVLAPAYVVITPSGTPLYKVLNSTLYIPLDVAKNISPGVYNHTLLHELAHWIQDVAYNMTWASTTGGRWWIETAADNMVMLVDPAYVSENLTSYGRDSFTDQPLSLQLSPYQWPREEFYVQAQIVKLNMCHDPIACPLSEASFAQAINKGTFPYDDSTAKAKLSANLDDYALYLLGVAPRRANSAIPRGAASQFGVGYGESINIRQSYNELFFLETTSYPPQVQKDISGALPAMAVSAVINKDGVYPLLVNAGKGGKSPGLPAALVIQPGAPFWYNVDGSEPQYHEGSTELRIMPIHLGMGAAEVRVVALGKQGGEVFQARVEILDLSGAWAFLPGKLVRFDSTCDDDPESAELLQMLGTGLFVGGTFSPDAPGSNGLSWSVDASKMPPDYDASMINLAAEALVDVENVRVQAHMELLPPTTGAGLEGAPDAPSVALAALGVFPLAVFISWRGRRRVGLLAVSLALLSLVGCEGFSFSGTVDTDLTFTRLEYVGNETSATIVLGQTADTAPPPLWRLSGGNAVYTVDITVEVHEDTGPQITSCSGEVVYEMVANIYTEAALIVPEDIE